MQAPGVRQDLRELPRWILVAGVLHALWFLVGWSRTLPPRAPRAAESLGEQPVLLEETPSLAAAPGGGSPAPDPAGPELARPEPSERAVKPEPAPRSVPTAAASEPDDGVEPPFMASAPEAALRPKPARRSLLAAPAVAARSRGSGSGAHGGPGGLAAGGGGAVNGAFDFGGRAGAFRGDVCFFQPKVKSISEIRHCPRAAVFFTDHFDVSPRRFDRGFPGVSQRIEWFAIRFTGSFTVTASAEYRFRLISDDGALLYVDDQLVIDNDGHHPPRTETRSRYLAAGTHRLFLSYFQGPREMVALQLFVTPPGGRERLFGPKI